VKRLLTTILCLVLLAMTAAGLVYRRPVLAWLRGDSSGGDGSASTDGGKAGSTGQTPHSVWALGRLEPADGVVQLSAAPGDRLLELLVREGAEITPESELCRLESQQLRAHELELVKTQLREALERIEAEQAIASTKVDLARVAEEQAVEVGKLEIEAQSKKLDSMRAAVAQAERELERLNALSASNPGLVAAQDIERQDTLYQRAAADLQAADAALKSARSTADYQARLARLEREAAERALSLIGQGAPLQSLQLQIDAAQRRLLQSQLRSPIEGVVLRVFMQPGELVGQKPILQVADLQTMECLAEVAHDQIQHISEGQTARITSKAFGASHKYLEGRVVHRSPLAGSPEMKQLDPFAASDRMTLQVRIELDERSSRIAADFVHLQVDVEFLSDPPQDLP
jgi:HlyD family secretion protein